MTEHFGADVRRLRETAGLTLKQAGELVGRDLNTVWRWEAGRVVPGPLVQEAVLSRLQASRRKGTKHEN